MMAKNLVNYFKSKQAWFCESVPIFMQGTCSPCHSLKDNIKGKTNEWSGNKTRKASVTRKCLNKGIKIA